ncbi:DNA damage-regulated autophagy modulator protein 1 [Hippoglossus hippoglossus]|uniref:DNA damage-regulated autophagy modulator protein 1 n=1 Tax=Hippoglossus hippoglossus TaxID=8267 RepID=UPI00148B4D1D|nr:DNA damage-regulated autophagy modulator protein 1 [Hippoglossus hippoglossus]XP_035002779.1 DNA damage-regulated autophagy modulator protein 1 [Hippoglossus stenolepis]
MFWFTQGLCFLPVFLVVWSSSTFIISYLIAIYRRDVDLIFPYISDTAAKPPESCIFGLMTFISACAGIFTIYARYKFVEKLGEETGVKRTCLNRTALVGGLLSCLSMCIVATFQEIAVRVVHDIGAILFFVSGVVYIILQSVISYQTHPFGSSSSLYRVRSGIALLAALAFFPAVICAYWVKQSELIRDPDDKDYPFYLASAVCEWVVAFSFILFFLTYIDDFKVFTLRVKTELEKSS